MSGLRRQETLDLLRKYESRNVTWLPEDSEGGVWPIVWERAKGMRVWDCDGKEYLDFTAAFGVAAAGHAPSPVVRAGQAQMETLLHAMGDVHPHSGKARLAKRLSGLTWERWSGGSQRAKVIFCNSGFEAVEAAMKSACQISGRERIICFQGAYHGLGYGALVAADRDYFRGRFGKQLAEFADVVRFPRCEKELVSLREELVAKFESGKVGGILAEPIQGRGGMNVPPFGFLPLLREVCDQFDACLILDEIYTGFGRTGKWFAGEHEGVAPDFLCVGKALTGGFPLSACVGRSDRMDAAWPKSEGEAIHTSTYLGHPVGCAMALAQLERIEERGLVERSARAGIELQAALQAVFGEAGKRVLIRGRGLMIGAEFRERSGRPDAKMASDLIREMLKNGFLLLPSGELGNVIGITPPLIVTPPQIHDFASCFGRLYFERKTQ